MQRLGRAIRSGCLLLCTTLYANVARISVAAGARCKWRPKQAEHLPSYVRLREAGMKCLTKLHKSAKARRSHAEWMFAAQLYMLM